MARTEGSGWGGGVILYQECEKCHKKKAYYKPFEYLPSFRCTRKTCRHRFNSDTLIRKTYR